jgi:hypothetical protein
LTGSGDVIGRVSFLARKLYLSHVGIAQPKEVSAMNMPGESRTDKIDPNFGENLGADATFSGFSHRISKISN